MADKNITKSVVSRESGADDLKAKVFDNNCTEFKITHYVMGVRHLVDDIRSVDMDPFGQ